MQLMKDEGIEEDSVSSSDHNEMPVVAQGEIQSVIGDKSSITLPSDGVDDDDGNEKESDGAADIPPAKVHQKDSDSVVNTSLKKKMRKCKCLATTCFPPS